MAHFTDDWLAELYSKNDIVDVVSEYTTLNERGGNLWGLCPFHNEKTPSFSVSRDKQLYYCFGCKQGGNVTNFIMKTENLTFPEAVERLAKRVNMPLEQVMENDQYRKVTQKKKTIAAMNKTVALAYYDILHSAKGKKALEYLKKRGIDEKIIKRFGLGFAPDEWNTVTDLLKKEGFSEADIKDSGLVSVKNNSIYDVFRGRVMFPIINTFGDVIAFGGRVLGDDVPKYLNTRDTAAFNKRRNLYGLDQVRKLKGIKGVVIVEGYMDVVSLSAHGVKAVVASLGTALTKQQATLIKRYTNNVFIAYDGDEAGRVATMKALDILEAEGLEVHVLDFDEGLDPDDFIRKHELAGFAKKVKNSLGATLYRMETKKKQFNLETQDGKEGYAIEAAKIISKLESPIKQERYISIVASQTGFSTKAIEQQMGGRVKRQEPAMAKINRDKSGSDIESVFLAYAMANPQYLPGIAHKIHTDDFGLPGHKKIFSVLLDYAKRGIQPSYAEIVSELETEEAASEAARLSAIDTIAGDPEGFLSDCADRLRKHVIEKKRQELKEELQGASGDRMKKLLAEISGLDKELRDNK